MQRMAAVVAILFTTQVQTTEWLMAMASLVKDAGIKAVTLSGDFGDLAKYNDRRGSAKKKDQWPQRAVGVPRHHHSHHYGHARLSKHLQPLNRPEPHCEHAQQGPPSFARPYDRTKPHNKKQQNKPHSGFPYVLTKPAYSLFYDLSNLRKSLPKQPSALHTTAGRVCFG